MNIVENNLYIVPTPIGNLQDITLRAIDVLKSVDIICAEDTRHSMPLLEHIGAKPKKLLSFHDHNEVEKSKTIVSLLAEGNSVALISDAGTPLISDPGYHLVAECVQSGYRVVPLPGACAAITALCASGMPTDRFSFEGFLPVKEKSLKDKLQSLNKEPRTMVFYEAPRRIMQSMEIIGEVFQDRCVMVGREMTKTFESFYYGKASEMINVLQNDPNILKGEMVIVVAGYKEKEEKENEIPDNIIQLLHLLCEEIPTKKACKIIEETFGYKKNDLYKLSLTK